MNIHQTHGPEIPDDLILFGISPVIGVFFPVFNVNVCNASNQELQFTLVEDIDKIGWYEFIEPSHKRIELFFYALLNSPFCDEPATGQSAS